MEIDTHSLLISGYKTDGHIEGMLTLHDLIQGIGARKTV